MNHATTGVARGGARLALALVPLALLAGLVFLAVWLGPARIFPGDFPPVEDLTIQQITFRPGEIVAVVTNGGPEPVNIAQVLVDDAYWEHQVEPSRTLDRLQSARVTIPYPWVEGEPVALTLISSTGLTFTREVEVATETPTPGLRFLLTFAALGIYIGVIPVLLGMTWRPFLLTLSERWLHFLLAFTAGVLVFLGVETLFEAAEQADRLPTAFGGIGIVTAAAIAAFALILAGSRQLQTRGRVGGRLVIAYAVALGIGLHNVGEGLAVGAAYRLGEIALGSLLVIGFAVHNVTEGIGIVSILGRRRTSLQHLGALGLIAGVPTIFGAWGGAFALSPVLAAVFLAVAAGAIAQVVVDVLILVRREALGGLLSLESLAGMAFGLVLMYLFGLLAVA